MKQITKRMLAVLLTLVMVIGFVPSNLSVSASAEENTIYVATTGDDTNGNGSQAAPYETIQKALNTVPANNTVPTTIEIDDGAYNVFIENKEGGLQATTGSTDHNLVIRKNNVTLKAKNAGEVILYSYTDKTVGSHNIHWVGPTVAINQAQNVTLDGLRILPALRSTKENAFTIAVETDALYASFNETPAIANRTLYMPHSTNYGNIGTIAVASYLGLGEVRGLTIQNCDVGYQLTAAQKDSKVKLHAFYSNTYMYDYHLKNNTVRGGIALTNTKAGDKANEIIGNAFYDTQIVIEVSDAASLPIIKENSIYSVYSPDALQYSGQPAFVAVKSNSQCYNDGELSVIALANTRQDGGTHALGYYRGSSATYVFLPSWAGQNDKLMDTEEELCYYLGQEGDVTLTQDFTITKDIMPEEILANLDMGTYTITTSDNTFSAPSGYKWVDNVLTKDAWISTALLLQNDLNMKFYVAADRVANGEYLVVTMNGNEVTLSNWQDGTGANEGKKFITFEGIAATRMAVEVSVQLYDANGDAVAGCDHVDSIRKYAERLKAAYSDNTSYKNLINALLAYGAAAQVIENSSITEEELANYGWSWN